MTKQLFGESSEEKRNLSGFKVILVEDNEMNRIVAKKFMTHGGPSKSPTRKTGSRRWARWNRIISIWS